MELSLDEASEPRRTYGDSLFSNQGSAPARGDLIGKMYSLWPEWVSVALYSTTVASAIPFHEPWADEAQAWQLARSLSLRQLFQTYIRYEGSPGLWYFLLRIMIRAHVTYTGLHWICGAIAIAAVSLLIFKSPFPRYLKLTLPFTYFLLFQYAIIARSYLLVPPLLFLVASWWKKGPVRVALVLGLLANASLHAAVISGGLSVVYTLQEVSNGDWKNPGRRRFFAGALILLCFYAFALWTAWPPHDLLISRVRRSDGAFFTDAIASLVLGICEPWILSIPFWCSIVFCLGSRQRLLFLLPVILFASFSGTVYAAWWHIGLLVPLLICVLWITWPAVMPLKSHSEIAGRLAMVLLVGTQLLWSAYAFQFDHFHAYSPDLAAANFLKPFVREGASIAITYIDDHRGDQAFSGVGILPYFDHRIYANQTDGFWWWSEKNPTEDRFAALLPSHPKIVVLEARPTHADEPVPFGNPKIELLLKNGYALTNVFCGSLPQRLELQYNLCHLTFQYNGRLPAISKRLQRLGSETRSNSDTTKHD